MIVVEHADERLPQVQQVFIEQAGTVRKYGQTKPMSLREILAMQAVANRGAIGLLKADVMSLDRKRRRQGTDRAITCREERTRRAVIQTGFLASQPRLKKIAVLALVVKASRQRRLGRPGRGARELLGERSERLQKAGETVPNPQGVAVVCVLGHAALAPGQAPAAGKDKSPGAQGVSQSATDGDLETGIQPSRLPVRTRATVRSGIFPAQAIIGASNTFLGELR